MRLVKIDGYTLTPDRVNGVTPEKGEQAITEQDIVKPYLEKLRADIEVTYDELDGYDPDALGTFASRIDDLIDNLLSESEVKANENEK